MIAYRATYIIKRRCMQKALELLREEVTRVKPSGEFRVYTPDISPDLLVFEHAWESLEENERFWTEYDATPESAVFYEKWWELVERRVGNERWALTKLT